MIPGNRLTDVSHAIEMGTQRRAHEWRAGIVEGWRPRDRPADAHGSVPAQRGRTRQSAAGRRSVLAIEPMLTLGTT